MRELLFRGVFSKLYRPLFSVLALTEGKLPMGESGKGYLDPLNVFAVRHVVNHGAHEEMDQQEQQELLRTKAEHFAEMTRRFDGLMAELKSSRDPARRMEILRQMGHLIGHADNLLKQFNEEFLNWKDEQGEKL